jgi:AcrR family transcriptional regulator
VTPTSGKAVADLRTYRGVPADQRRAERRARLIEAGLDMFGTKGIAATRVDDVCAAAGLTKRYFYESFDSLDDLVNAVVETVTFDIAAVVVPAIQTDGWRNPRPVFEAYVGALLDDPRLVRLLVVETHNGALASRREEFIELAVDTWLASDPSTDKSPEFLPTQRLLAHAMAGAAGEVALAWVNGRIDLTPEELIDQLVRIFERITPRRFR